MPSLLPGPLKPKGPLPDPEEYRLSLVEQLEVMQRSAVLNEFFKLHMRMGITVNVRKMGHDEIPLRDNLP